MIKLSNVQIDALVEQITLDLTKEDREFNDSIINSEEYENFTDNDKDCIVLKEMAKKYNFSSDMDYYCSKIRYKAFENKFRKIHPSESDIKREILLRTIDADDLASLMASVSAKFK